MNNMNTWNKLRKILNKNQTIDNIWQQKVIRKKEHRRQILVRILLDVKCLTKHILVFQGSNEKLHQDNNKFLGVIEMTSEFDVIKQACVRHIQNREIYYHYLGHNIQNEFISLFAHSFRSFIIKIIKEA